MELTDEELMLQVYSGKLQAMTPLFERYHVRLYNFFYHQTHDKSISEDLTQNVFERVMKYRTKYKKGHPFLPWIFAIARNIHMDLYRKKTPYLPGDDKVMTLADKPHEVEESENIHSDRLRIARHMDISAHALYGSIEAEHYSEGMELKSTYGGIKANITSARNPKCQLSSTYSYVDLTVSPSVSASVIMDTGYGRVFTNMELDIDRTVNSKRNQFGEYIATDINGSKGSLALTANYGNIYLRGGE